MVRCGCDGRAGERCQNCPAWIGLGGGGMDELLEMRAKHCGKLGTMYPLLA